MRYTKKITKHYSCKTNAYMLKDNSYNRYRLGIDKLGLLEDIEEELGIDLIKLLKAKTTFYKRDNGEIEENDESFVIDLEEKGIDFVICDEIDETYMFADYGKTWAFSEEELKEQ